MVATPVPGCQSDLPGILFIRSAVPDTQYSSILPNHLVCLVIQRLHGARMALSQALTRVVRNGFNGEAGLRGTSVQEQVGYAAMRELMKLFPVHCGEFTTVQSPYGGIHSGTGFQGYKILTLRW